MASFTELETWKQAKKIRMQILELKKSSRAGKNTDLQIKSYDPRVQLEII